ncbi:glycoside hydrolase family 5 protein [bacterium]|nr:glycoside hydrolase family 5 protein [bacterium]
MASKKRVPSATGKLLALFALAWVGLAHAGAPLSPYPLSTAGRHIVDSQGNKIILKAVNWYGPHLEGQVVQGLDQQPIENIVDRIKEWGFNAVRLPFSNAMLHDKHPVDPNLVKANPQFRGLTPLQVFDRTVEALAKGGVAIILNNHTSSSQWCCGYDANGLWFFQGTGGYEQTFNQFVDDWKMLAARYRSIPEVVAADLRNEVRTAMWGGFLSAASPNWGAGGNKDWHQAAQFTGNQILKTHKDFLIIVEGINWQGALPFMGGKRPHLRPVRNRPIQLDVPGKLVYAAHNYSHIGPKHNGDKSTSKGQITYGDMTESVFLQTLDEEWGYVLQDGTSYQAPVILSEFGASSDNATPSDRAWFERLTRYLYDREVSYAYWPLNHENYGLVNSDYSAILDGDWRRTSLDRILRRP